MEKPSSEKKKYPQRNIPIDENYRDALKTFATQNKTTMKAIIQGWIDKDNQIKVER